MKRIFTLCALLMAGLVAVAQEAPAESQKAGSWSTLSTPALKASEFMYDNWSKSGNSQIDVTGTFFGNYKYTHPKFVWDNIVDLAYGYAWQDLDNSAADSVGGLFETRRKSNDKIDITSAISWNAYKGWGASFTANLKTQFGNGYEYDGIGANQTQTLVSSFFAPAYLTTALSFEYKKLRGRVPALARTRAGPHPPRQRQGARLRQEGAGRAACRRNARRRRFVRREARREDPRGDDAEGSVPGRGWPSRRGQRLDFGPLARGRRPRRDDGRGVSGEDPPRAVYGRLTRQP